MRGRRGTNSHLPSFCVAGVSQTHIYHRFAWHAWHKLTSTVVLRGRCGTDGTGWRGTGCMAQTHIFHTQLCHTHTTTYNYIQLHTTTYNYIQLHTTTYNYIQLHTTTYNYIQLHTTTYNYIHTYIRTYVHTYMHTYIHTYIHTVLLLDLSPPPLSFLPSLSPLKPLKLIIGRS